MIQICYAIFLGFWRRWFGGLFGSKPILGNRFIKHCVGFLVLALCLWYLGYNWFQIIVAPLVFQGLFWSRSHECCFDFGHRGTTDTDEYKKLWYWKYIKKYIPEKWWYTFEGDYFLMSVRYTIPAILMSAILLNVTFLFAGVILAGIYALCWICDDFGWTKRPPTEYAEVIAGFVIGLITLL